MAVTELDSFVNKFKSLWSSGHQAKLTFNSKKGKVWLNLQVGLKCHQPHLGDHQGQSQGNARHRRNIRRAAARAAAHAAEVIEEVTEAEIEADPEIEENGASVQEVASNIEHLEDDSSEKRNNILKSEIKLLEKK